MESRLPWYFLASAMYSMIYLLIVIGFLRATTDIPHEAEKPI